MFSGPHPFTALQALFTPSTGESELLKSTKVPYTRGFLKEALHLHPLAAILRVVAWEPTSIALSLPSGHVSVASCKLTSHNTYYNASEV